MIVEGSRVIYAGDTDPFNEVGAAGKVVSMSGDAAHVQWTGGPKTGSIELVELHELISDRHQAEALLATHSAYIPTDGPMPIRLVAIDVRASYDEQGEDGAITALDESGHLATLADHAESVWYDLIGKIASDEHMREALSALETDERDVVVAKIATTLLTDRLREV